MKLRAFFAIFSFSICFTAIADLNKALNCYDLKDYSCAVLEFQKAADQGHALAQYNLGVMYKNGQGVEQDYASAVEWYQKAVAQEHAPAQYSLGVMYEYGQGVAQDVSRAIEWYQKAAVQGHELAQYMLVMLFNSQGLAQDYAKAKEWYLKAADQGHALAQYNLGVMYESGLGVAQDYVRAKEWYQKASDQGNATAKNKVIQLSKVLNCLESARTELFGVLIKCARRDNLMAAVKEGGVSVKLEDKNKWGDVYHSATVLKGTSELEILYTVDDRFAKAQYTFPSNLDAAQIVHVRDFVVNKYGNPNTSTGNVSLGDASFEWRLVDGIILKVSRGWPDTTTYLSFTYPENYQATRDEQERQRKKRESEEYSKQNNAF